MLEHNEQEALQMYLNTLQKKKKSQSPVGFMEQTDTIGKDKNKRKTITTESFFVDRPTNNIFLETSIEQEARIKANSPFGHLKTWRLIRVIVKSNDDVRQE